MIFFSVNPWPGINFLGSFCANSCAMKIVFISNSNYYFYVHSLSAGHAWFYSQTADSAVRAKKNRNTLRVHCTWLIWTSSRGETCFLPLFISITYFILTALFHSWLATKGGSHSPCSRMPGCQDAGMPGCQDADAMTSCLVRVAVRSWWLGPRNWNKFEHGPGRMAKPAPSHLHKVTTATTITGHESLAKNLLTCPWSRN